MKQEKWKPIKNYEGMYEVSNLGRVRRLDRWVNNSGRITKQFVPGKLMIPFTVKKGNHLRIRLRRNGEKQKKFFIHRLVLESFVGSCPMGMEGCHNNGNPQDNRLENLRWDTAKANKADARRHGTLAQGERSGPAKLKNREVEIIKKLLLSGVKIPTLTKIFNVTYQAIWRIKNNYGWKSVVI